MDETYETVKRAAEVMGYDIVYSYDRFERKAMDWLAERLGDLHIEYHKDDGWDVSCCYREDSWDGRHCANTRIEALAMAVLAVKAGDHFTSDQLQPTEDTLTDEDIEKLVDNDLDAIPFGQDT